MVMSRRDRILEEKELKAYQSALNGTFDSCDVYIANYPAGKYIFEINKLRTEKYANAEDERYRQALEGSFIDCDAYLRMYPGGKYFTEVSKKRAISYKESEFDYYMHAVNGDLLKCETYLEHYSSGQYAVEVTKLKTVMLDKFLLEVGTAAEKYSLIILEDILKSNLTISKTSGYVIPAEEPFIMNINQSKTVAGVISGKENDAERNSGISSNSRGRVKAESASPEWELSYLINGSLVGKDNQPVTVIQSRNGFADFSEFLTMLKTAEVTTKGWKMIDSIRFELINGVISYRGLHSPGIYSEGSTCISNGKYLVFNQGSWNLLP